jgi:hypothetical protein
LAGAVVNKRGARLPRLPLVLGSVVLSASFLYFLLLHDTKLQVILGFMVMGVGKGFMLVSMINIIIQSVRQGETGIATAMNTLFRNAGGVIGPTIASVLLAEYVSPLVIQTPRGPIPSPLLPNAAAFNYIFLTALAISLVGVLVTLFVTSRAAAIEAYEPVKEAAAAV